MKQTLVRVSPMYTFNLLCFYNPDSKHYLKSFSKGVLKIQIQKYKQNTNVLKMQCKIHRNFIFT